MPRSVKEWIGRTDDSKPPEHVVLRIFRTHKGICHISGRKIRPRDAWHADHVIALVNGGANRESNMAPVLIDAHKAKSAEDVAIRAKTDRVAKRHLGIARPKQQIRSAGFPSTGKTKPEKLPVPPRRPMFTEVR